MVYTPTYYSIRSLCKSILPFKRKRLPAADRNLGKLQTDNLKWQQDSFHQMLNLIGLHREGILADHEVSAFRVYLLETLIDAPPKTEPTAILRDKLLFLQELLYAKCISQDEYHASKRPLLQRLAVQGAEIGARDVIFGGPNIVSKGNSVDLSVIELKESSSSKSKSKHSSVLKQVKGVASVFGHVSPYKSGKSEEEKSLRSSAVKEVYSSTENPFWNAHLKEKESETKRLPSSESVKVSTERATRKPFRTLFLREETKGSSRAITEGKVANSAKKQSKNSKRNDLEDETLPLPLNDRLDSEGYLPLTTHVSSPLVQVSNTKQNMQPSRYSPLLNTDKTPAYKNEFVEHIGETEKHSMSTQWTTFSDDNRYRQLSKSTQWTTFDNDDENYHPNLFASQDQRFPPKLQNSIHLREGEAFKNNQAIGITNYNPFLNAEDDENISTSANYQDYNPFATSSHGPSLVG